MNNSARIQKYIKKVKILCPIVMSSQATNDKVNKMLLHYKKLMKYCKKPSKAERNSKKISSTSSFPSVSTALKDSRWNNLDDNGYQSTNSREIVLPANKAKSNYPHDERIKEKCRARRIRQSRKVKTLSMLN